MVSVAKLSCFSCSRGVCSVRSKKMDPVEGSACVAILLICYYLSCRVSFFRCVLFKVILLVLTAPCKNKDTWS